jgi:enediyne biosynthesis protein E4
MTKPTPRQRKLQLTITVLAWITGGILITALVASYRSRPSQYDPNEETEAITSRLRLNLPDKAPEPRFEDITETAGLSGFETFRGPRTSQLPEDMGGGVAFGDFDNDGDDDLFLVSAGGNLNMSNDQLAPCLLYRNRGTGEFDIVDAFPDLRIRGMGAAWGDFDDDGFIDLVVTGYQSLHLYRNEGGSGQFSPITLPSNPAAFWAGASWGDFDNDRDLDLYLTGYLNYQVAEDNRGLTSDQFQTTVPFTLNPASFESAKNSLYRNDGGGTFLDIAEKLDISNPEGRSLGAMWCDFDQDGWLDLYVANDVSDNAFYSNQKGVFSNIAHTAWVADYRSAMGLAVGDWNRDGDDDLFVTHWVAQENALYDNTFADFHVRDSSTPLSDGSSGITSHPAPSSTKPKARFVDIADMHGVGQMALPYVGWGTEFADLDQDGWLDVLVANGSTLEIADTDPHRLQPQELFLLWNHAGQTFHDMAPGHTALSIKHVSRGLAVSDVDGDGDLDFAVVDLDGGVRLFRNDMAHGNWMQLRLRSRNAEGNLLGRGEHATVTVEAGGQTFRRTFNSISYLSQSSATLHFGLGAESIIERVEVKWHSGEAQVFRGMHPNAIWELSEGVPIAKRIQPTSSPVNVAPLPTGTGSAERDKTASFWKHQRSAMNAFKRDRDFVVAASGFARALALKPDHEEALFYRACSLIELGQGNEAARVLRRLTEVNPQSLRGYQQWGTLRALTASSDTELAFAEALLLKARAINPEETGVLQVLAEVSLKRGTLQLADERLAQVIASNARAARALFLRGYIAWKNNQKDISIDFLHRTLKALGPEWRPKGTTSEGDVQEQMHIAFTPYSKAFNQWDGSVDPSDAFRIIR